MKLHLIEMDAKHETYGELAITESGSMVRIGVRASIAEGPKRPEYAAHLGAYDALRLAYIILASAIGILERDASFDSPDFAEGQHDS